MDNDSRISFRRIVSNSLFGELLYSRRFFPNALEPDVLDII